MQRILCPMHKEETPSCIVYKDHLYCYGCGWTAKREDCEDMELPEGEDPTPEDLEEAYDYIDSLPQKEVRGLSLPCDEVSYFVPWPNKDYYKRRFYEPGKAKYLGAKGHKKPLFVARLVPGTPLVVIEGEINALSVAKACPELSVISPGGAGDFHSKSCKKYLQSILEYNILLVVADRDAPGAEAVIEMVAQVSNKIPTVKTLLMEQDANDLLTEYGIAKVREEIFRALGKGLERSS